MGSKALKLSDLEEGERFRLLRTGERYLLTEKGGTRYKVQPINGSGHKRDSDLNHACHVERIQ